MALEIDKVDALVDKAAVVVPLTGIGVDEEEPAAFAAVGELALARLLVKNAVKGSCPAAADAARFDMVLKFDTEMKQEANPGTALALRRATKT